MQKQNKAESFKNNPPFINCVSKINGLKIDNTEDLDVVMPMYNLLEYSINYRKTTGSLWNHYRDEPSNPLSSDSESFKYKTGVTGNTYNDDKKITDDDGNEHDNPKYDANKVGQNETEVVIPLNYLSNFLKSLNIPLINCEVEWILTWSKNCVLADMTRRNAQGNNPAIVTTTGLVDYVPVVTLSKENDTRHLEQLKSGFKKTIKWNKYRSQTTIQPQNNDLIFNWPNIYKS